MEEAVLAKHLLQLFFNAPLVKGLLVFEDNDYLGVVFKKDVELGVSSRKFVFDEQVNYIRFDEIQALIFCREPGPEIRIPVVDKSGSLIKIISFDEFESVFYFNRFIENFTPEKILDNLGHPLLITNCFKRILYLNKQALMLVQRDYLGERIALYFKNFSIEMIQDNMFLTQGDKSFRLLIGDSNRDGFDYLVYQLVR